MPTGHSDFNEVFFDNVFVPDADVVGEINYGWTVARATLGNESVSIGGGQGGMAMPADAFIAPFDEHPERLAGGAGVFFGLEFSEQAHEFFCRAEFLCRMAS